MGSWRKLLDAMVAEPGARAYSYADAAKVLGHLGFTLAGSRGSHRRWRTEIAEGGVTRGVIVGLIEPPRGQLPPEYVKAMIATLRENHLLPVEVE